MDGGASAGGTERGEAVNRSLRCQALGVVAVLLLCSTELHDESAVASQYITMTGYLCRVLTCVAGRYS